MCVCVQTWKKFAAAGGEGTMGAHGHSSELTPTPFSAWLALPPARRQTKHNISSWKYLEIISITATLLSIYPYVKITEELKYVA